MILEGQGEARARFGANNRGYAMAALLVGLSVMSVLMGVMMPVWSHAVQREKEEELIFRGQQYARAIGLFQRKFANTAPPTIDLLVEQRFLRKKYKDPITNDDFQPLYANQQPQGVSSPVGSTRPGQTGSAQLAVPAPGATQSTTGTGAPGGIIGVTSKSKETSIKIYNGRTKYNENRFEEAVRAFEECLKLDPRNVKAEDNLGLSYQALGRTDDAIATYRNAMAWQEHALEKNVGPVLNMGILQLEQNKISDAVALLLQAEVIAPNDSRTHEQLAKAYSRLEDFEKAQAELEKAVQLDPNRSSLRFMLGQIYRKRGLMDKAKIELDKGTALKQSERKNAPGVE